MRSLRSAHFPRTRHARTRLCHRTLPMPCIPTWSFSPALDPMKFRAASPRGAFDPARVLRPVARAMVTKSGVVHATVARRAAPSISPTSRARCVRAWCLRAEPWIPRRHRCLHRRSRPLPRRPVTSAAFLARRTFHRRVLFPRRHRSDAASNRDLRHDRGARGAWGDGRLLLLTPLRHGRHRRCDSAHLRPFRRDPRSRRHGKPELLARASLDLAVAGPPRSAAAWCRLRSSTSATIQFST